VYACVGLQRKVPLSIGLLLLCSCRGGPPSLLACIPGIHVSHVLYRNLKLSFAEISRTNNHPPILLKLKEIHSRMVMMQSSRVLSSRLASTSKLAQAHANSSSLPRSRGIAAGYRGRKNFKAQALLKAAEGYTPTWSQTTDDVLIKV